MIFSTQCFSDILSALVIPRYQPLSQHLLSNVVSTNVFSHKQSEGKLTSKSKSSALNERMLFLFAYFMQMNEPKEAVKTTVLASMSHESGNACLVLLKLFGSSCSS